MDVEGPASMMVLQCAKVLDPIPRIQVLDLPAFTLDPIDAWLMDVAAKLGIAVQEREFSRGEMLSAREVFITAATSICFPIVEIDGLPIANGHPGVMAERIRSTFFDVAEKTVI